jgi:lycopene cyclase domain-containing protein
MEFQNYWYTLIILVMSVITMFLFVKKTIVFFTELKYMLPAILFSGAIFILFNHRLLETGIISFNPGFLAGKYVFNLPVEELLFLLVISLFSFSVYILITVLFPNFEKPNLFLVVSVILLLGFGFGAWYSRQKLIPFFIFFLITIYLGYTIFRNRFKMHLTKFYVSYAIAVIPYFLIKGLLYSLPVILYNSDYTLGIRLLHTPVEEFGYFFLLMLINITIFEYLKDHRLY